MSAYQQTPIFSDIAKPFYDPVRQSPLLNYCQISTAGTSITGNITTKPQCYRVATSLLCWTNYDDVAPVTKTANSNATLGRPFTPNNFTLTISRGSWNNFTNRTIPQAEICSSGYRAGKIFPNPITYSPRSNFLFTFQDTTGLFLLTATSEGTAVPLRIYCFLAGYDVPIENWPKFCRIYPQFYQVYGTP